jgi:hypothetical protein
MTTIISASAGPAWLQYVAALGTAGAAIFAGWAAFTARSATKATSDLVKVEVGRDRKTAEESLWRQARRITVELAHSAIVLPDGRQGNDVHAIVHNASSDPVSKIRLKVVVGESTWGPQLLGTLQPSQTITLTARIVTKGPSADVNAFVRFYDIEEHPWIANAQTFVQPDVVATDDWISQSTAWGRRNHSPAERGIISGQTSPPDFDRWRLTGLH